MYILSRNIKKSNWLDTIIVNTTLYIFSHAIPVPIQCLFMVNGILLLEWKNGIRKKARHSFFFCRPKKKSFYFPDNSTGFSIFTFLYTYTTYPEKSGRVRSAQFMIIPFFNLSLSFPIFAFFSQTLKLQVFLLPPLFSHSFIHFTWSTFSPLPLPDHFLFSLPDGKETNGRKEKSNKDLDGWADTDRNALSYPFIFSSFSFIPPCMLASTIRPLWWKLTRFLLSFSYYYIMSNMHTTHNTHACESRRIISSPKFFFFCSSPTTVYFP